MKFNRILFAALFFIASGLLYSQELGEKVYKEVIVNGEKVYKWLKYNNLTEYDAKGNKIHEKDCNGDEYWFEYDANGKLIHYKSSDGFEKWYEYDSKGNQILVRYSSDGDECMYEYDYDSKGNMIHSKFSGTVPKRMLDIDPIGGYEVDLTRRLGVEEWHEYDLSGKEIHGHSSAGEEWWCKYEYDSNGNEIYREFRNGSEVRSKYNYSLRHKYDLKGNKILESFDYNSTKWYEYDSKGNNIHTKSRSGTEYWYEYDSKGNKIHAKEKSLGFGFDDCTSEKWSEYWYEYDAKGNVIHEKDSSGHEKFFEYTFNDNGKIKTRKQFSTF